MSNATTSPSPLTIGLDLGDRKTHACGLDDQRKEQFRKVIPTTREAFDQEFRDAPPARIVLEAGSQSLWISTLLRELGHDVLVVNPRTVKLITQSTRKTDKRDAEMLARLALGMPELLGEAKHRTLQQQAELSVIRSRDLLVRSRTKMITHVRGILKAFGIRLPRWCADSFARNAVDEIPDDLRPALIPVLEVLTELEARIRAFDKSIEEMTTVRHPEAMKLRQVAGVGAITAATFVLSVGDPTRFARSRDVGAWLGLCPKKQESGDSDPQLGITKEGNGFLRRLLVTAAHYIIGPFGQDSDLRRFGQRICERGGGIAKKRAVVAVARKLAVLLHYLMTHDVNYDPLHLSKGGAA